MVRMPSRAQVRITRTAISPRLATRTLLNTADLRGVDVVVGADATQTSRGLRRDDRDADGAGREGKVCRGGAPAAYEMFVGRSPLTG